MSDLTLLFTYFSLLLAITLDGVEVKVADYPYHVSLERYGKNICSGAVIAPNKILTAAHCVWNKQPVLVRCGSDILLTDGQEINTIDISIHPNFKISTVDYDVGVLTLEKDFEIGIKCAPISLSNNTLDGSRTCSVSGWSFVENKKNPKKLNAIDVQEVPRALCEWLYSNVQYLITKRMICFGNPYKNKGPCKGDSGGPLVDKENRKLVGVISWGSGCEVNYPVVYANVALVYDWIIDEIERKVVRSSGSKPNCFLKYFALNFLAIQFI